MDGLSACFLEPVCLLVDLTTDILSPLSDGFLSNLGLSLLASAREGVIFGDIRLASFVLSLELSVVEALFADRDLAYSVDSEGLVASSTGNLILDA